MNSYFLVTDQYLYFYNSNFISSNVLPPSKEKFCHFNCKKPRFHIKKFCHFPIPILAKKRRRKKKRAKLKQKGDQI